MFHPTKLKTKIYSSGVFLPTQIVTSDELFEEFESEKNMEYPPIGCLTGWELKKGECRIPICCPLLWREVFTAIVLCKVRNASRVLNSS